ncbi:MAG: hypothetical protein OEV42_18835 [Deltaproteobacteria bacterium]|nr:hypothetical protein [Deltaproteobacteria bacterium]
MSFQITYKNKTFRVTFAGCTSINEINDANSQIQGSIDFDRHKNQIWDFTRADASLVTKDDTLTPAATDLGAAYIKENINIALVAVEEHAVNMCKAYVITSQKTGSPWNFKICSTIEDAFKWLKI